MTLAQDINPVNSELMDTLVEASKMEWLQTSDQSFMKNLFARNPLQGPEWFLGRATAVVERLYSGTS